MSDLNLGAVRQPNMKAISHMLLVVSRGVEFESVVCSAGIGDDRGGSGGN